jgi:hypothetical protein
MGLGLSEAGAELLGISHSLISHSVLKGGDRHAPSATAPIPAPRFVHPSLARAMRTLHSVLLRYES